MGASLGSVEVVQAASPKILGCAAVMACVVTGCTHHIPQNSYDVAGHHNYATLGFGHKESLPPRFQETYKTVSETRRVDLQNEFVRQAKVVLDRLPAELLVAKPTLILGTSIDPTRLGGHNNGNGTIQIALEMSSYYRIAHEIGHNFQHDMTASEMSEWNKTFARHYKNESPSVFRFDDSIDRQTLIDQGFVSQYSYQNWKEDFAEIFASMVIGRLYKTDLKFWEVYEQNELVRMKTDLVMKGLRRHSPGLTIDYFKNLPPLEGRD